MVLLKNSIPIIAALLVCSFVGRVASAEIDVSQKLDGFDAFMIKAVNDWNAQGVAVGIVVNDKLVFSKGYGYRDYEKKLAFTPKTICPIASNTKLFTVDISWLITTALSLDFIPKFQ